MSTEQLRKNAREFVEKSLREVCGERPSDADVAQVVEKIVRNFPKFSGGEAIETSAQESQSLTSIIGSPGERVEVDPL